MATEYIVFSFILSVSSDGCIELVSTDQRQIEYVSQGKWGVSVLCRRLRGWESNRDEVQELEFSETFQEYKYVGP